ncbi:HD-GYP domain-containing protein [Aneurinibacillus tyrosinisolvens]|uniref:HD-GYP domain-containing protein n=1 Tax=Aneurinibacillus tyrosinisolvens TaxID=1443435 RepID=UPI00063F6DC6|nr:HD-GYP domain-containing protein [Aneurinibacillus tyrosinisolvens]
MKLVDTSYELIGHIMRTDIYNEEGILLLGSGKMITAKDVELLLRHGIYEVAIQGESAANRTAFDNLDPLLLHQIDTAWSYDPMMADYYKETLSEMKELFTEAKESKSPNVKEMTERFSPLLTYALEHRYTYHPLHTLKGKDEYTFRHSINVGLLSALIGRLLHLPDEICIELGEAGLFHDIGKIDIPDEILNKPEKLTEEEAKIIHRHTQIGHHMLRGIRNIPASFADVALLHHERLNGSGYPFGLRHENIPLSAQIVAVADKFDALSSERPYRAASSPFQAAAILMESQYSGRMNPAVVTPFVSYILEAYIGSRARLSNGEEGVIVTFNEREPLRPLIRTDTDRFYKLAEERHLIIEEVF